MHGDNPEESGEDDSTSQVRERSAGAAQPSWATTERRRIDLGNRNGICHESFTLGSMIE
jgi:hypothetical protein